MCAKVTLCVSGSRWAGMARTEDSTEPKGTPSEHAARTIQNALSHDFVPAHPITILGCYIRLRRKPPWMSLCSSYGHLFDVLVKTNLGVSKEMPPISDNVYICLNWRFYVQKPNNFVLDRLQQGEWHFTIRTPTDLPLIGERIVSDLVESQVLSMEMATCRSGYKYHYYYFAARYFADHISDPDAREHVSAMSRCLYNEDSANIILFICHFSKDRFIINSIIDIAKTYLNDTRPVKWALILSSKRSTGPSRY